MYIPMTTITFHSPLDIDRLEFDSLEDFLISVFHIKDTWEGTDFHELHESELSNELKNLIQKSLDKKTTEFSSISVYDKNS